MPPSRTAIRAQQEDDCQEIKSSAKKNQDRVKKTGSQDMAAEMRFRTQTEDLRTLPGNLSIGSQSYTQRFMIGFVTGCFCLLDQPLEEEYRQISKPKRVVPYKVVAQLWRNRYGNQVSSFQPSKMLWKSSDLTSDAKKA